MSSFVLSLPIAFDFLDTHSSGLFQSKNCFMLRINFLFIKRDPWLSLPFEALEAVTVHMMAVASSIYCAAAAPPGLLATLNGAVGSAHYSFGKAVK